MPLNFIYVLALIYDVVTERVHAEKHWAVFNSRIVRAACIKYRFLVH